MAEQLRPDIAAAAARLASTLGAKREIRKLVEHLWEGERVEMLAPGQYGNGQGLLTLTDRRLLFLKDGWTGAATEDFPLNRISSVAWASGMVMGTVTVFASGNKTEIKSVPKAEGKAMVDRVRAIISGWTAESPRKRVPDPPQSWETPAPSAPTAGSFPAVMEQLRQLAELRDAGIISAADFESKKAELLARI
jgi:hypothetical protein